MKNLYQNFLKKILVPILEISIITLIMSFPNNIISFKATEHIFNLIPTPLSLPIILAVYAVPTIIFIRNKYKFPNVIISLTFILIFVFFNPYIILQQYLRLLPHGIQIEYSIAGIVIPMYYWYIQFVKNPKSTKAPLVLYGIVGLIVHIWIWYFKKPDYQVFSLVPTVQFLGITVVFVILLPFLIIFKYAIKKNDKKISLLNNSIDCILLHIIMTLIFLPFI